MHIKAIVTDLDGTALDSPDVKLASNRLAQSIIALEGKGIKVCVATGRPESFAMPVLESMGLQYPAIIAGGTRVIDPRTRGKLWSCDMSVAQVRAAVEILQNHTYGYLWNDYVEDAYASGGWPLSQLTDFSNTYFLEVCYIPEAEVPELVGKLSEIEGIAPTVVLAQRQGMRDIHITNASATKEHAIYELAKMLRVDQQEMIGIGDGHNDVHLFNAVGHKVAMGNAVPELKELADEVIGNVKDEGLAAYFEKLAEEHV